MTTLKVFISPNYAGVPAAADNGGIRRVVEAEIRHLPEFGVTPVSSLAETDVIQNHGSMMTSRPGVPIVHTGHGLYWSRQPWGANFQQVNSEVVESMCRAVAHTVPSRWVDVAVRRGGLFYPEVVYHGVDIDEFEPSKTRGDYVLWNKARADYVSDPQDMQKVAELLPDVLFSSTIGRPMENVRVLGLLPHADMKQAVARAGVYLCTARETFGIGTLEAMAMGVPVAGWDWGGQSEIIRQGETGYLAKPGDFQGLAECIRLCLSDRERLGANAREDVRLRWGWEPRIQQYADIFKRVADGAKARPVTVSVIVTTYNLDRYLPTCLDSVLTQTFGDWECVVVDDAGNPLTRRIVEEYAARDARFSYHATVHNLGLPGARNFGAQISNGKYLRHLDADDYLAPGALNLEAHALDTDPGVHIVYGHLESVREDGSAFKDAFGNMERGTWPPDKFSWLEQMAHLNQLPSCVMMRREVQERAGGYRERMARNEDAEFWCRVTSLGFRARKITQAVTYYHRQRDDSKGTLEWKEKGQEPDWTAWFPWRVGATNHREAMTVLRRTVGRHPAPHLVPFGAQGRPDPMDKDNRRPFWYVHDYAYPQVSVIVTCGPGHETLLIDALDSIQAQSYTDWECVVVNDTGTPWKSDIIGAPWARVVNMDGNQGAAAARNAGLEHTSGRWVAWMDADDYWLPWFLEIMVGHGEKNDGVIYSDMFIEKEEGKGMSVYKFQDFPNGCGAVAAGMRYAGTSVMIPREIAEAVRGLQDGWDVKIQGMEDWDYQVAVHSLGYCAYYVPEPLFVYRMWTSTKREADYAKIDAIRDYMNQKWYKYRLGVEKMPCGCSGTKPVRTKPTSAMQASGNFMQAEGVNSGAVPEQMVVVEYMGQDDAFRIRSKYDPSIMYRFGTNAHSREQTVYFADAQWMCAITDRENHPLYRIVSSGAAMETRDPQAFLGEPIKT